MEDHQLPLVVAHRGASYDAPENTIPAFELAWRQNADAIEGDFQLTKDGEILCIHDSHTSRVANCNLPIADSTHEQLRKIDVGKWRGVEYAGTTIPTLSEVIAIVPQNKQLYVELKSGPEIVQRMLCKIDRANCTYNQIRIISLNKDVIRETKMRAPNLKAYWLSWIKKDASGTSAPTTDMILSVLRQTGADGFGSSHELIARNTIENLISAGYEYHVWTVDDPQIAKRFHRWGATSVTSNVPGRLKTAFSKN